ncbi:LysR family transcriptional regulator [Kordiimonas aquimaris]|uniref:LysR family transcriptional regulator n=1 Tax=Kordiimonas aquimaris TaxID=707591 RepID=UPI0021CE7C4F|nr:LysR family transcriptional regulator [Kordiimonas aquimaris]
MKNPNWERLRIFKTVLESHSLSGAARQLGVSQPTVSRQIHALEQELGETLLHVTPDGVQITPAGSELAPALDEMLRAANQIASHKTNAADIPTVRISCGPWLANFFSRNIHQLTDMPAIRHIELISSILFADIPRREADIAIRTKRPESGRMKVRRLPDYAYAIYGGKRLVAAREDAFDERRFNTFDWAMLLPELDHFPTAKWLVERTNQTPILRCSSSINLLDAVKSNQVLAILPCFAGDAEPDFVRVCHPFVPDSGQIWMVTPDDISKRPHIRETADKICALFRSMRQVTNPDHEYS